MNSRFAFLALLIFPLAACDEAARSDLRQGLGLDEEEAQPADPSKPRPPAVSPLEVPIETGEAESAPAVNANAETVDTQAFVARGNNPVWFVETTANTATYKTQANQSGREVKVSRLFFTQGVEYVGTLDGLVFKLTVRGTDCVDSVSGEEFPMSASLLVGGKTLNGCASPAADS